jgi:WD40 repeat protein
LVELRSEASLCAANRGGACAAAASGPRGLVAFGSGPCVAVYDPRALRVQSLLRGHGARVTGCAWVPALGRADETELISCAQDGALRVWHRPCDGAGDGDGDLDSWRAGGVLAGHTGSVTAVACAVARDGALAVASVSADCSLRLWWRRAGARAGDGLACAGGAAVPPASAFEAVAVTMLPRAAAAAGDGDGEGLARYPLLIAAGGVDCKVHLFSADGRAGACVLPLLVLTGPTDWVRCLSFSAAGMLHEHGVGAGGALPDVHRAVA